MVSILIDLSEVEEIYKTQEKNIQQIHRKWKNSIIVKSENMYIFTYVVITKCVVFLSFS